MKKLILFTIFGLALYFSATGVDWSFLKDQCSVKNNPQARFDPDCLRKRWGDDYYVPNKVYYDEVAPYLVTAERFKPGSYVYNASNGEKIVFTVKYSEPFYCGKVKRYLYNRVTPHKKIRLIQG